MIYIANWGRTHIAAARLLIGLLHVCLMISTTQLSQLMINAGIHFPFYGALLSAAAGFGIIAYAGFRRRKLQNRVTKMRLQKFRFLLMGICCTLLVAGFFSNLLSSNYSTANSVKAAFTKAEKRERPLYENYNDKKVFFDDLKAYYRTLSKKELRKELQHQLKSMAKVSSGVETVVFAVLISFAMLALISGIAVLSCSLACNGQGALAILVLVGGITGIVLLVIYLGKLFHKDREKRSTAELKTHSN